MIATFGAQVVDSFYVKDMFGLKLHTKPRQDSLERKLREAIDEGARPGAGLMRPIRLVRGFLTVGGWTLASRVARFRPRRADRGLSRHRAGGRGLSGRLLAAQHVSPLLRRGGVQHRLRADVLEEARSRRGCRGFAEDAFAGLAFVVLLVSVVAMLAMPWLVLAMAGGFAGDERLGLAVDYGRICFPYILFISLTALLSGLLNAGGRFVAAAGAPVLLNLIFIGAMLTANRAGLGHRADDGLGDAR